MTTFFLILVTLTFINFLYEGIIAPSLRFDLRLKLFALRDELRELKIERADEINDDLFRVLQGSINATINRLSQIDLRLLVNAYEAFKHDENLRKFAEEQESMLKACPVQEATQIRTRHIGLIGYALAVNGGGWIPYLVPVAVGVAFTGTAMALVSKVFSLPENDINRIAPPVEYLVPA